MTRKEVAGLYDMCAYMAYTWRLGLSDIEGKKSELYFSMFECNRFKDNEIYRITSYKSLRIMSTLTFPSSSPYTPPTPIPSNYPRHLQQLPIKLHIPRAKINPPPRLRLSLLPRPLLPLRLGNIITSTTPYL